MKKPLYTGTEWDVELVDAIWHTIDEMARKMGFDHLHSSNGKL
jgi:hypothetical protein